jgi:hypothetical protein
VAALRLRHLAEDLGAPIVEAARDQVVDGSGLDLAAPCLQEAVSDIG